ncbi:hypothetical protein N8368_02335 [Bacteroidia bacterium]|nr:hypothetical protein [Bacteroidia bacterium]MDB9882102.1 hypothetical protein [Bacteroidia bacterium]MDC1395326.1 hypothetical protein [Bacteroidia bacterium]
MKKSLLILFSIALLNSCISDITDTIDKASDLRGVEWNPTLAAPLVYSRLHLKDLLDEVGDVQFLKIGDDGSMTLVYADEYESQTAEEAMSLQNQSYWETFSLTAGELSDLNTNGSVTLTYNRNLSYLFGQSEMDKVLFKGGAMEISYSSTLQHDISFKFTIVEGTKGGSLLSETLSNPFTSLPNTANSSINLDGMELDFTKTGNIHSEMEVIIEMTVTKKGSNPILPVETISYGVDLVDQEFTYLQGFFDSQNFSSASDQLDIDFFSNNSGGTFTLADPRIKFVLKNSMGFPLEAKIIKFDGTNSDNQTVSLAGLPDPFPVPNLTLAERGLIKTDSFSLNKGNSNLASYINNRPAKNTYEFTVNSLATGATRQWALDTSRLGVRIEIEVPMEGTAKDYVLESTQSFDIGLDNTDEIKEVLVRLYTENGFPVDIATQLYFEDSASNVVLDSLITSDILILPSADVDGTGKVSSANPKTTDIVLNSATIARVKNADRIRIKARFNTPFESGGVTQPDVKFYDVYDVLIQLGVQAEVLINQEL